MPLIKHISPISNKKPLTVKEMAEILNKAIEEGHGDLGFRVSLDEGPCDVYVVELYEQAGSKFILV